MMERAILLGLLFACPCPRLAAQTMDERARAAAASAAARSGSSEALQANYLTPGMSGQPISTIDGRRHFPATIACQKTQTLLELLVQPSSTGDITSLRVSQDTDFDGSFDQIQSMDVPISGICANGIISCQPGTWNQCRFLEWGLGTNRALRLGQVEMAKLAGCYCVNNSCGTNLVWANLPDVLKDLGGGMVAALTSADPRIGIAQAQVTGPVIAYVGAQTTGCAAPPDLAQTGYRASPASLQGDAASLAAGNSIFQRLAATPAGTGKLVQTRACTIEREVTLSSATYDDIVSVSGSLLGVTVCGDNCRIYRVGGDGNCDYPATAFALTMSVLRPERLRSVRLVDLWAEDWTQARVNGAVVASAGRRSWLTDMLPAGGCEVDGEYRSTPDLDLTDLARTNPLRIEAHVHAGGGHRGGYLNVRVETDTSCSTTEHLIDLCSSYAADAACRLRDEQVDGVTTFQNGVGTGLRPFGGTRLFGTDACKVELTRDFFERNRTYACVVDTGSPPEPDLSRGAYIIDHSTEALLADQTRAKDGSTVRTERAFTLPDRVSVPSCEAICKTRAPHRNTAAAPAGVTGSQQNDPTGWDTFYHGCTGGSVCPAADGEEIVSACGCLDDFPEAVVMMQSVRLAGADMICTSATP